MHSPKSLHNLQHDEGGNYMAETETETMENRKSNEIKWQISWISFICFLKCFPLLYCLLHVQNGFEQKFRISPCYLMSLFSLHLLNLHHFFLLLDNHIMFGIETNLVIKSLFPLWLNHSLLFDCRLVKTSILFQGPGGSMS